MNLCFWRNLWTALGASWGGETLYREASRKDPLTGLFGKFAFEERAKEEWARAKRFDRNLTVVFLDLDGFKAVNDKFGHAAGDQALKAVGRVLLNYLRGSDVAGRFGGDEFWLLLPETSERAAEEVILRLFLEIGVVSHNLSKEFGPDFAFGCSFGVANSKEEDMENLSDLFASADKRMYEEKDLHHKLDPLLIRG